MMSPHDDVMRTIIDLPEPDLRRLDALCRVRSISRAQAVRLAVRRLLLEEQAQTDSAGGVFGLWRDRAEDGVAYQDRLRDEWAR